MAEVMKINLTKTGAFLVIILTLASVVGGGYIAYDNAKIAKTQSSVNATAISELKTKQARFEGVIDERTKNTQEDVKRIYDIVKNWEP
jgi:hypothetical protein